MNVFLKQVLFSSDMDIFSRFADFVAVSVHQLIEDGQVTPRQAVNTEKLVVELPREESHGDLACNAAMVLAKQVSIITVIAQRFEEEIRRLVNIVEIECLAGRQKMTSAAFCF